jgi:hypothetical protein
MSARFEAFLAKLYVDAEARSRFLNDSHAVAVEAGLDPWEVEAATKIDLLGLRMTADSLQRIKKTLGSHVCEHPSAVRSGSLSGE